MEMTNELDSFCGVSDDELTRRFSEAVRIATEITQIKGNPVARYDEKTKQAFLEFPDGHREYAET